ncbi:MAG: TonB-dependent receptor [Bacteroidales bacterium]|nr:TonB-dependent receptor [Bacteroidales bacterium]
MIIYSNCYADNHKIEVLGKGDKKPVSYASVYFEGLISLKRTYEITSEEGVANNPVHEKSIVYISLVGYKSIKDTVSPGESKTYFMEQELINLNQVVVTGTRTEKRLANTPVQTIVISNNDIQKAGSVSTLESLQDCIPGIVSIPNAMGNNMRIRGLNSRYILFMVDGERLVSEGATGNINLDQIDFNNIDRIEVVNEAAAALYGSNAVGGVINIITKKPKDKLESSINASYQSHNTKKLQIDVGSKLNKLTVMGNAFRNSSNGFDIENGPYAARYADYGAYLKAGYKFTDRFTLNLSNRFFQHELFNPGNSMNVTHDLDRKFTTGVNAEIKSKNDLNSIKISTNIDKYYTYNVLEKKHNDLEEGSDASYISTRLTDTFSSDKKWEIVAGTEQNHEQISTVTSTTLGPDPTTKRVEDINLFGQVQYTILTGFDIIAGTRYTYNNQFKSAFTPKLSLMYKKGIFTFRGGIGTAFRAPSIKELYYNFDHQGMFWIYGNPDLKAEKGLYSSLSSEITKNGINASLSVYQNKIENKITEYIIIDFERKENRFYKNVSSATLKGLDINVSYLLLKQFIIKGTYSYCNAQDDLTELQLDSNVKHSGTLSLSWKGKIINSPFSLQIDGRFNSPILYQSISVNNDGTEVTTYDKSSPYDIWKITMVKPFKIGQNLLEITMKCYNVFAFKEESFIDPGRQLMIGIRYKYR